MADTTQDTLLESFQEAAGGLASTSEELTSVASSGASQSTGSEQGSAQASSNSAQSSSGSGGSGSEALSIATTVLESGLGIVPLVAGLIGLFTGGGGSSTPPPLVKYAMPDKMQFEGTDSGGGMSDGDYDQMGMPRAYGGNSDGTSPASAAAPAGGTSGASPAGGAQVQVNVQAMDAQSFLDHSNEIAQAVRSAMLNLSSINDVVNDL